MKIKKNRNFIRSFQVRRVVVLNNKTIIENMILLLTLFPQTSFQMSQRLRRNLNLMKWRDHQEILLKISWLKILLHLGKASLLIIIPLEFVSTLQTHQGSEYCPQKKEALQIAKLKVLKSSLTLLGIACTVQILWKSLIQSTLALILANRSLFNLILEEGSTIVMGQLIEMFLHLKLILSTETWLHEN